MKKALSLLISLLLCVALASCGTSENNNPQAEPPVDADVFLQELAGTYEELFPVLTDLRSLGTSFPAH
jgi:outer membrane PBP1 activator LpoA protein